MLAVRKGASDEHGLHRRKRSPRPGAPCGWCCRGRGGRRRPDRRRRSRSWARTRPLRFLELSHRVRPLSFLVGWGVHLVGAAAGGAAARSRAPPKPPLLAGRRLWAIRAGWLVLFAATAVVYAFASGGGLARSHTSIYFPGPYDEFVATRIPRAHRPRASAAWAPLSTPPGWYPWLVAVREALVFMAALAIAWSVFARRPRHWMAYFVAGLIALGPLGDLDAVRFPVLL